jgi:hypothetical protein
MPRQPFLPRLGLVGFTVRWLDEKGGYAPLNIRETPLTLVKSPKEEIQSSNSRISFSFYTSDIENAYRHLVKNKVKVESIEEDGHVKWFKFQDLEGNCLEVCYFKE